MINAEAWMADLLPQLQQAFGTRLRYLGLQGSYGRGEASETSDIDVVVLLDNVTLTDLDTYRSIVHAMPEGQKACGFFSCVDDLFHWPRHELFAFQKDTVDYFGKLESYLPAISVRDATESAKIGASGLIHMLTHSYLYAAADAKPLILKESYKAAFFVMLVQHWLATGVYCRSKKELLCRLKGTDKEIITAGIDLSQWIVDHSQSEAYATLLRWCSNVLQLCSLHQCTEAGECTPSGI